MALEDDISWMTIASGTTHLSGKYIIEEKIESIQKNTKERRLIFLINQNFIQTEVTLLPINSNGNGNNTSGNGNGNKKNKNKNKKNIKNKNNSITNADISDLSVTPPQKQKQWKLDCSKMDSHH